MQLEGRNMKVQGGIKRMTATVREELHEEDEDQDDDDEEEEEKKGRRS